MRDLALGLAEQGFFILPCAPDKRPLIPAWQDRSTTDPDTIRNWWDNHPEAIPGVHAGKSGLVVFDLEGVGKAHNGATPEQNAETLKLVKHETLTVRTPSGGLHFYFRGDAPAKKLYVEGKFVGDRKAENGYVIPAGVKGYTVERGGAIARLPEELLKAGVKASGGGLQLADSVGAGERNDYLTAVAGGMKRYMRSEEQLFQALVAENQAACKPPVDESEVRQIVNSVMRYDADGLENFTSKPAVKPGKATTEGKTLTDTEANSDLGNARRFVARWGHAARFVHEWGMWVNWDGTRWRQDTDGQTERWAVETIRHAIQVEPPLHPACDKDDCGHRNHPNEAERACRAWLEASESRRRLEDALRLASTAPGMHVTPDDLDRRADLLNCPNGMVDLRTGELLPHDPEALCTQVTNVPFDPTAESERFNDFLREVFPDRMDTGEHGLVTEGQTYDDNGDTRDYIQRIFGYSLLGAPEREQCFFMHYGASASGKSTLLEAMSAALGDYQEPADVEAILARKRGQHPHDLARLRGKRLVDTSELDSGERISESVVKRVTAGERISARFMRQNLFTYLPTWVIHVTTNHGFTFGAGGPSMERRIHLIPWTVSFVNKAQDKMLRETLKAEGAALLRWAVEGAVEYHQRGQDLSPSQAALDVRREVLRKADPVAAFVGEVLIVTDDESHKVPNEGLYEAFNVWWSASGRKGEPDLDRDSFGQALSKIAGMPKSVPIYFSKGDTRRGRKGVRIRAEYTT